MNRFNYEPANVHIHLHNLAYISIAAYFCSMHHNGAHGSMLLRSLLSTFYTNTVAQVVKLKWFVFSLFLSVAFLSFYFRAADDSVTA